MKKLITICLLATLSFADNCYEYGNKAQKYVSLMILASQNNNIQQLEQNYELFNLYIDLAIVNCNNDISESFIKSKQNIANIMKDIVQN